MPGLGLGSPPRGRGKVSRGRGKLKNVGITPAWAGKSLCVLMLATLVRDHPRVGGEKRRVLGRPHLRIGSPPRGRGKVFAVGSRNCTSRITPAWAGKSRKGLRQLFRVEDHPRVGGEKSSILHPHTGQKGSPPRGRGKGGQSVRNRHQAGITPAWAGKSIVLRAHQCV